MIITVKFRPTDNCDEIVKKREKTDQHRLENDKKKPMQHDAAAVVLVRQQKKNGH